MMGRERLGDGKEVRAKTTKEGLLTCENDLRHISFLSYEGEKWERNRKLMMVVEKDKPFCF